MTDLNSLMIFAKVVEAKGFSEAARRLKMPTSTVSRRVADLEDQLGVLVLLPPVLDPWPPISDGFR
jgi:DNA-binding transcriptional LysR family regulator